MDMKKILQALDGASSKPVEGGNDMQKFMSIVTEGKNPQTNRLSVAETMTMQHYNEPVVVKPAKESAFKKYFQAVEAEVAEAKVEQRHLINQYAQIIAERVMMKENFNPNMSPNPGFAPGPGGPGMQSAVAEEHNEPDAVTVDIPLLIRLFEYAREDAKTDMDLHNVTERLIRMSEEGRTLTMDDYADICPPAEQDVNEAKKIKPKKKSDPCWADYKQVGMQKKDGKTVPKCVSKKLPISELSNEKLGQYKKAAGAQASAADKAGDIEKGNKRFSGIVRATNKQFDNDTKKHSGK